MQDEAYFRDRVAPRLGRDGVTWAGSVAPEERDALLGGALALLHLIAFPEPFGLSVVESLATGTPVLARPLGSMPELVRHGRTGFLVEDADAAVAALARVGSLHRQDCRTDAEERFSSVRMVASYAALFARVSADEEPVVSRSSRRGTSTKAKRTDASLAP